MQSEVFYHNIIFLSISQKSVFKWLQPSFYKYIFKTKAKILFSFFSLSINPFFLEFSLALFPNEKKLNKNVPFLQKGRRKRKIKAIRCFLATAKDYLKIVYFLRKKPTNQGEREEEQWYTKIIFDSLTLSRFFHINVCAYASTLCILCFILHIVRYL
jgi:hypothetical protein